MAHEKINDILTSPVADASANTLVYASDLKTTLPSCRVNPLKYDVNKLLFTEMPLFKLNAKKNESRQSTKCV